MHKHILKKIPMLERRLRPSCFQAVFMFEHCICIGELILCVELEQEVPVVIKVTNAVPTKDSFPGH